MSFKNLRPYFVYTRSQRLGLLALFLVIFVFQAVYWIVSNRLPEADLDAQQKQQWIGLQASVDTMRSENKQVKPKIYPFNPNFISDFKGYQLGMSVAQIDKLHAFRETGKFVNSAREFQQLTGISDSLLTAISPYFKFPDWVKNKYKSSWQDHKYEKPKMVVLDINAATKEDLKRVYGIGDGLSERILKEKEKFGAFVSMEQMKDVWGLSEEVIAKLNESFKIMQVPEVKKIKINDASVKELAQFPYFRYALAKQIVAFRSMNHEIDSAEDLIKIPSFPVDKVKIIALYLEF